MKSIEDLNKAQAKWRRLVLVLIIFDIILTITMDSIDLAFTYPITKYKLLWIISKIIISSIFTFLVLYVILKIHIEYILIVSLSYLILGIILFSYLLFDEIKTLPNPDEDEMIPLTDSRPKSWRTYKIYLIIIILNCLCGISRIVCSMMMILFRRIAYKISLRLKNESLIQKEDDNHRATDSLTLKTIEKQNTVDKSISDDLQSKGNSVGMNINSDDPGLFVIKEALNSMRKTYSSNSFIETNMDKFETPRVTTVLRNNYNNNQ